VNVTVKSSVKILRTRSSQPECKSAFILTDQGGHQDWINIYPVSGGIGLKTLLSIGIKLRIEVRNVKEQGFHFLNPEPSKTKRH
jgi:hypothetical protein